MKTINTSLPIYDKVAKQCFERGKKGGQDRPVPILCPRHRLPSFQWNDDSDGAASVSKIEIFSFNDIGSESALSIVWGIDAGFDTFDSTSGLNINEATNAAGVAYAISTYFTAIQGTKVRFRTTLTLNAGTAPVMFIAGSSLPGSLPTTYALTAGANDIEITSEYSGTVYLYIYKNGATDFKLTVTSAVILDDTYDLTYYFPSLPAATVLTDTYFTYEGDTLNYLLPVGIYYLKITMDTGHVYYSDWFKVDCVYENLITSLTNVGYNTFTNSGTAITSAIETGSNGEARSTDVNISVRKGEVITAIINITLNSGELPFVVMLAGVLDSVSNQVQLSSGLNIVSFTITQTRSDAFFRIFNTTTTNYSTSEVLIIREYSEKYLTINFSNDCDLGDIIYQDGFLQTVWFESEPLEMSFPQEEQGMNNGDGRFVRAFARQVKKYVARTKEMPAFMVEVFNRMKLHHEIELIDLVGDVNDIYNLEVTHEWLGDDKYYARIDLTFDHNEAFVVAGCCNNVT